MDKLIFMTCISRRIVKEVREGLEAALGRGIDSLELDV